jgi:hypothetical protein
VASAARAAIPARQPLAIEAPAPLHARLGVPAGSGDLAMARLAAGWPEGMDSLPELLLPVDSGSPVPGLPVPADRQQAPAARVEDVVTAR